MEHRIVHFPKEMVDLGGAWEKKHGIDQSDDFTMKMLPTSMSSRSVK